MHNRLLANKALKIICASTCSIGLAVLPLSLSAAAQGTASPSGGSGPTASPGTTTGWGWLGLLGLLGLAGLLRRPEQPDTDREVNPTSQTGQHNR